MTDAPNDSRPAPRWKPLDETQRRVFGVLIEKAKTTPGAYPMSVNAIVTGCNQKSNRDPLMTLDDFTVEKSLDELRNMGAVSEVDWMGRVSKWKHHAYEWLGISKSESAVMTELLLRGAQSIGDLRARAARMEPIEDLGALKPIVAGLVERGLMIELSPAGRGQMVSHNLYLPMELEVLRSGAGRPAMIRDESEATPTYGGARPSTSGASGTEPEALAALRAEVASLRERIEALEARLTARSGEDA